MFLRSRAIQDAVTIYLDGTPVPAERGEPCAVALIAADKLALARSPKLHRPRGPACFRGACDGCLARVDGVPNVMTCLTPALGGERIETQNVVGSPRADLLAVTDWFFPQGIDHHHLMAGVPGVSGILQSFARKLAGLGTLPEKTEALHAAARLEVEVAIVGGGPAGLAMAAALTRLGRSVAIVDDGLAMGGLLRAVAEVGELPRMDGATVFSPATAAGVYLGELLVVEATRATVVRAKALVFASGAHDPAIPTPNNDRPGVLSARALCLLAAHGVRAEGKVAVIGDGPWATELARHLGEEALVRVSPEDLESIQGSGRVRAIVVRSAAGSEKTAVDAVALATQPAPAFEIAAQAGARIRFVRGAGYAVEIDERGRAGDNLWAIGECTGAPFDPDRFKRDAEIIAADIAAHVNEPAPIDRGA